jgi:hypothetical protein
MKKIHLLYTVLLLSLILSVSGCTTPQQTAAAPTFDVSLIRTEVVAAIREQATQEALVKPTESMDTEATQTPYVITATFEPTSEEMAAIPSFTPMSTKQPAVGYTYVPPTPTWGPARMVNQTPVDGTTFHPGESFDVSWTFINSSTKNWNKAYYIRYIGGDLEPANATTIMIGDLVDIGRTYTFTVDFVAPGQAGKHTSSWEIVDDNGAAMNRFYITINVE